MSVTLYGSPGAQYAPLSNHQYTADSTGRIDNVAVGDKEDLLRQGCIDATIWRELEIATSALRLKQLVGLTVYTLATGDDELRLVSTSATELTLNVPFGLALGFECEFVAFGAGDVRPVAAPGVTIRSSDGFVKTAAQYSLMTLKGIAQDVYILTGDGSV